jgi:hypothetical protein
MPLPKRYVHQLPVMLDQRQHEHVLKVADGGSQAQVCRDALDLLISVFDGELQTIPAEELRELQRKAELVGGLVSEVAELTDLVQESRRRQVVSA